MKEKFEKWMNENNVSRNEFSEGIGISRRLFDKKLSGESEWKLTQMKKVLEFTNGRFDDFF